MRLGSTKTCISKYEYQVMLVQPKLALGHRSCRGLKDNVLESHTIDEEIATEDEKLGNLLQDGLGSLLFAST